MHARKVGVVTDGLGVGRAILLDRSPAGWAGVEVVGSHARGWHRVPGWAMYGWDGCSGLAAKLIGKLKGETNYNQGPTPPSSPRVHKLRAAIADPGFSEVVPKPRNAALLPLTIFDESTCRERHDDSAKHGDGQIFTARR